MSLVTRLQLRVKELEWEQSVLHSEIDTKTRGVVNEYSSASVDDLRTDAVKVCSV